MVSIKGLHERVRSILDDIYIESHEVRGVRNGFEIIQKYSRDNYVEKEELYINKKDYSISLYIDSIGTGSLTIVKDGKIEAKKISSEELEKTIKEIMAILGDNS
ncbi:hypothetical protein SUSAZ_04820 [Sulfolobus acidocaldarius SUSAZ]|nr:hypothetical protein SUSAZ_04820 [Sulfolobus acidocaldarius SUSAZ]